MKKPRIKLTALIGISFMFLQFGGIYAARAQAAVQSPAPSPKITFAFDDGYTSALTQAAPTLAKYGFGGTNYIITGCVGMTKAPNTCRANTDATYMSWTQISQLQNTYHWEIGSHSATHPYLASSDASDGQPNVLTAAQMLQEISQSRAALAAHGINAASFATPYGDYNNSVLATIAKYYTSQRGFADTGYNSWPYSDYLLRVQPVQAGVSVATVKKYIDTAAAANQWLILVFHNIKTKASSNPDDYEYSTANLNSIASYVKSKTIPVTNVSAGLTAGDINLLPNASFNNGIANGWTTDSPANVTKDAASNGSYPDAINSIKFVSSAEAGVHLFSPAVGVDSSAVYMLKNFINVVSNSGGEAAFYIDEYDGFGNWVSGQYKAAERGSFVEDINFSYQPSSANVAKARLQVIVTKTAAPGGITAYLDNCQWYPLTAAAPAPAPAPSLLPNYTFDAGLTQGWRTDSPAAITANGAGNGSPTNPVNSVRMTGSAVNTHLFSPVIGVDPAKTYSLSSYLDIRQIASGEVAFYIDEYSSSGAWVSGRYIAGVRTVGKGTVSFSYKPTSANVAKASLQIIQVANSNVLAYFDDVIWRQN